MTRGGACRLALIALVSTLALLPALPPAQANTLRTITTLELKLLGVSAALDPGNPVVPKNTPAGVRVVVSAGGDDLSRAKVVRLDYGVPIVLHADVWVLNPGIKENECSSH